MMMFSLPHLVSQEEGSGMWMRGVNCKYIHSAWDCKSHFPMPRTDGYEKNRVFHPKNLPSICVSESLMHEGTVLLLGHQY